MFRSLSEIADRTNVLVVTGESDPTLHVEAIELGGRGVVLLEAGGDVLLKAVAKICAGEVWLNRSGTAGVVARLTGRRGLQKDPVMMKIESLTAREREIIGLVTEGLTNHGLAAKLFISEATARNHMTSILDKLDLTDRFQLTVYAFRQGLVMCPQTSAMRHMAATMLPPQAFPVSARRNGDQAAKHQGRLTDATTAVTMATAQRRPA
jgi:DNA-binding NarL/FixJ family response regulator